MLKQEICKEKGLVCQSCKSKKLILKTNNQQQYIHCNSCNVDYPVFDNIPLMLHKKNSIDSDIKEDIQKFWNTLYQEAYTGHNQLDSKTLPKLLVELKQMFIARNHLAVIEMPINNLKGKKVLEIGSGAGAHSALFSKHGAEITSLDLTYERVISTQKKLEIVDDLKSSFVLQGDAENLPFEENFFDIVYSNGVLHHTPDTEKTIQEVLRVLKPGGKAVIMLYAKHSYLYWINIFLLRGVILGNIFRHKNWLGRATEWMSNTKQTVYNPETKVFSKLEIIQLFDGFQEVEVRKSSFVFQQLPFIGKLISSILARTGKVNSAGILVYDHPWRHETKIELTLSKYIGFNLNISATK